MKKCYIIIILNESVDHMLKIDTSNCADGCDANFLKTLIDVNKDFSGTIYVYDNDMVDEECKPYSITHLKAGDKVLRLHLDNDDGREWTVVKITPATYGFMNITIADSSGEQSIAYAGDLKKI